MKKLLYILVMALMAVTCSKDNTTPSEPEPQPDKITLSSGTDTAPVVSGKGGTLSVSFAANTSWKASVNAADGWCTVSPSSGGAGNNNAITITVKENTTAAKRSCNVVIQAGTAKQIIKIEQQPVEEDNIKFAEGTNTSRSVSAGGGSITISFTANVSWEATVEGDAAWCKVSPASGAAGNGSITIVVEENTATSDRSATVKISAGTAAEQIQIVQQAGEADYITFEEGTNTSPVVSGGVGNVTVSFTTSESWEAMVDGDAAWCKVSPASGAAGNGTITIVLERNATFDARYVSVKIKAGNAIEWIRIEQQPGAVAGITFAEGTDTAPSFSPEGGTVSFSFTTNVSWEAMVMDEVTWCRVTPSSGAEGNGTITITVDENTTLQWRYASVRIMAGNVIEWIRIEQKPREPDYIRFADGANVSPTIPVEGGTVTIPFATNASWEATVIDGVTWCRVTPTSGEAGEVVLAITVDENTTDNGRYASVRVMAGNAIEWIRIEQNKLTGNEGIKEGEELP